MLPAMSRITQTTPSSMSERDQQRRDRRGDEQLAREVDLLDEVAVADERPSDALMLPAM